MAFFHFHGQKIAYQLSKSNQQGTGENNSKIETLVFLHGLGADRRQTVSTTKSFTGYQILTIDMPGHGETVIDPSENFEQWFSFETFSDIALALLDHLNIPSATFGGISMGAGISIRVALMQPERVKGLILVRPAWLNNAALPNLAVVKSIGEDIQHAGIEWAAERLRIKGWFQELEFTNSAAAESISELLTRPQALTAPAVLKNLVDDAPFKQLASLIKIQQPTIVFGNDHDLLHPCGIAEQYAELIPNARYQKLPSRYYHPDEHQKQLAQLTNSFLMSNSIRPNKVTN